MKTIYLLVFLFSFVYNYGQISTKKEINDIGSKEDSISKNDSIKDITTDISNNLKLIGYWNSMDYKNLFYEHVIGHCPVYINQDNIILEFAKWDKGFAGYTLGMNTKLIKMINHFLKYHQKIKSEILESSYNENLKYAVYKVSRISKFNKEKKIMYYLIGEKKDYVYFLACYNFNEDYFENIDTFLINLFKIN